jgi:RNA polymerase sigma-70 factor (ECF subfamily)
MLQEGFAFFWSAALYRRPFFFRFSRKNKQNKAAVKRRTPIKGKALQEGEVAMDEHSSELLRRWQANDQAAAEALFRRYFARLHALVQSRLPAKMAGRLDADDVVQSAFRSFFSGARDGRYVLKQSGDLWRLLAAIAVNKTRLQERRHGAAKRDLKLEQLPLPVRDALTEEMEWLSGDPTPDEAAALADEVECLLRMLSEPQRRVAELRLQGFTLDEIAVEVQCSQRTVRRTMEQIKQRLEARMLEGGQA